MRISTDGPSSRPARSLRVASSPSTFGHADVHQHDVGMRLAGREHRLEPVGGLAHDLDVGLGVEDQPEAGADERLVVGDEDADHAASSIGSRRADDVAAAVARAALELAAAERDPLAHAHQPVPAAVLAGVAARRRSRSRARARFAPQRTFTHACAGPAYLSAFVNASWTTR